MDRFVGKRLDGRYEIREIIGVGGMAVVYKAYDSIEDRIVAIKILKEEFASNEEFQRRFKNESKAIAVLSHPNIVKVFDVSFGDLIQYIVMEYIDGITLKEYIEKKGGISWNESVNFALQILRGLQHAHDKGIVHRDVKPQNIIVLEDKTIKVTDFGIARFARNESKTITDKAIGSVHYISPEQAKGEPTDEKADIYSLGVILYEMLTGVLPFEAESAVSVAIMQLQTEPKLPTHINPLIPLGLEQITMRAMQKDTKNRYKSAAEMLRDLELFKRDPSTLFQNTYFVDNSPTKHIDNFYYEEPKTEKEETEVAEEKETSKVPVIPILAGVAVTFIAAILVLVFAVILPMFNEKTSEFDCPDFTGKTVAEAKKMSEKYQFQFEEEIYYSTEEEGTIIKQTPEANQKVKNETTIKVWVSKHKKVVIPDITNLPYRAAKQTLTDAGFNVIEVREYDDDIAINNIIKISPAANKEVLYGSEVTLYISNGPQLDNIAIPNVVGSSESDAKEIIEGAGFKVTVQETNSAPNKKGYVVSQTPKSEDGQALEGSEIIIYVGNGKYKVNFNVSLNAGDYYVQNGYVTLWMNGSKIVSSDLIDFYSTGSISLSFETDVKDVQISIKLTPDNSVYHDYGVYIIDASQSGDNLIQNSYTYNNYPKKSTQSEVTEDSGTDTTVPAE